MFSFFGGLLGEPPMIRQTSAGAPSLLGRRRADQASVIPVTAATVTMVVTAAATVVIVTIVVVAVVAVVTPVVVVVTMLAMHMPLTVNRSVFLLIPAVLYEIDAFPAGAVAMAVLAPVPGMAGRDVQIEGRTGDRHTMDDSWLRVEQWWWWETANIDAAVEAGLTDIDRNLG